MEFLLDEAQIEYINEIAVKYGYKRDVLKEVFGMGFVDGENTEQLKQNQKLTNLTQNYINAKDANEARDLANKLIEEITKRYEENIK